MIEVLKQALDALETEVSIDWTNNDKFNASAEKMHDAIVSLRQAITDLESQEPYEYGYARRLAETIWNQHYKAAAPQWKPLDDLVGVLTQIDNMTAGLTTPPQRTEQNFCPRCGKQTKEIHTCTPPQENT